MLAELATDSLSKISRDTLLQSVLRASGDCIKILDLEGRLQFMSEGGKQVMEVENFGALQGCLWPGFWQGPGNASAQDAVNRARLGHTVRFRGPANTAKGSPRFWDVQVSPILGPDGDPQYILSISRDITAQTQGENKIKEMLRRQTWLTNELTHRIKNTYAIVMAVAGQTLKGDDIKAAREAFNSRMIMLSDASDIITGASFEKTPLATIVEATLAPHRSSGERFRVSGPDIKLDTKPAFALALALYELATNASKYGALSNDTGTVTVEWGHDTSGPVPSFVFSWREQGGPSVTAPARKGFGTRLLERLLANDFGGESRLIYDPSGVRLELKTDLKNLEATP